MHSLAELQQAFAEYLTSPDPTPRAELIRSVKCCGLPPAGQLGIYKNNVAVRWLDALADTYPAVERLVGKAFFGYAANAYAALHPPCSALLLEYGRAFPEFLRRFPPAASVPYLPDVALLEQLYLEAYHAPEAEPLEGDVVISRLRADDPEDYALTLHPSARLMTSPYPASRIWEANRRDAPIENLKIPAGAEHLLIIRPAATVEVRRLRPGAHAALRELSRCNAVRSALRAGRLAACEEDLIGSLASLAAGDTFHSMERIL
jgi:hypothetical protein